MPPLEADWVSLANGPAWLWWLVAILPLTPKDQLVLLSMKDLQKRLEAVQRVVEYVRRRTTWLGQLQDWYHPSLLLWLLVGTLGALSHYWLDRWRARANASRRTSCSSSVSSSHSIRMCSVPGTERKFGRDCVSLSPISILHPASCSYKLNITHFHPQWGIILCALLQLVFPLSSFKTGPHHCYGTPYFIHPIVPCSTTATVSFALAWFGNTILFNYRSIYFSFHPLARSIIVLGLQTGSAVVSRFSPTHWFGQDVQEDCPVESETSSLVEFESGQRNFTGQVELPPSCILFWHVLQDAHFHGWIHLSRRCFRSVSPSKWRMSGASSACTWATAVSAFSWGTKTSWPFSSSRVAPMSPSYGTGNQDCLSLLVLLAGS